MISRRHALVAALCALFVCFPSAVLAQQTAQTARAKALSMKLKCMCGGCNDAVGGCYHSGGTFSGPCDTALGMLKEINQRIARNETDDQILKGFVQEYGPTVLIDPPAKGFNLTAWVMPVVVPIIAFVAVWEVVRRWRHHARLEPAAPADVPSDLLARVQRDVEGSDRS